MQPPHAQVVEAAAQKLMMDETTNATERFTQALQLDELNLEANAGALEAQIMAGELEEAAGQVGSRRRRRRGGDGEGAGVAVHRGAFKGGGVIRYVRAQGLRTRGGEGRARGEGLHAAAGLVGPKAEVSTRECGMRRCAAHGGRAVAA